MHPIEACVKNPVKVSVGVLLVALFGLVAVYRMPMQLTPEVQRPTISIETRWAGGTPQEIEKEIMQKQEDELNSVENAIEMTSSAEDSNGRIEIEFRVGTDIGRHGCSGQDAILLRKFAAMMARWSMAQWRWRAMLRSR